MKKQLIIVGIIILLVCVELSGCNEQGTKGEAPVINFFTATPENIALGNTTVLNWSVTGADRVSITDIPTENVNLTGSYTIFPTRNLTTFRLVAVNSNGNTTADVTVYVERPTISMTQVDDYILIQNVTNGSISWSDVTESIIDNHGSNQSFATVVENDVDNDTYMSAGDKLTATGTLSGVKPYSILLYYRGSYLIFENINYTPTTDKSLFVGVWNLVFPAFPGTNDVFIPSNQNWTFYENNSLSIASSEVIVLWYNYIAKNGNLQLTLKETNIVSSYNYVFYNNNNILNLTSNDTNLTLERQLSRIASG